MKWNKLLLHFRSPTSQCFVIICTILQFSVIKSSHVKGKTLSVRHTFETALTFLFLLPSAPISVTGHQHSDLSATPAPHAGTSCSTAPSATPLLTVGKASLYLYKKSTARSVLNVTRYGDIKEKKPVNPKYGQRQCKSAHGFAAQWDCSSPYWSKDNCKHRFCQFCHLSH